jgi:hypothetical protein
MVVGVLVETEKLRRDLRFQARNFSQKAEEHG